MEWIKNWHNEGLNNQNPENIPKYLMDNRQWEYQRRARDLTAWLSCRLGYIPWWKRRPNQQTIFLGWGDIPEEKSKFLAAVGYHPCFFNPKSAVEMHKYFAEKCFSFLTTSVQHSTEPSRRTDGATPPQNRSLLHASHCMDLHSVLFFLFARGDTHTHTGRTCPLLCLCLWLDLFCFWVFSHQMFSNIGDHKNCCFSMRGTWC